MASPTDAPVACRYQDLDALCARAPRPDSPYCARHSCAARRCPRAQLYFSPYCEAHKCAVVECPEPAPAGGHGRFCERHACRHGGGDGGGCAGRAREGSSVCLPHRRCRWAGCARTVGDEGVEGLCARHREAGRAPLPPAGGSPPLGWAMPGQYPGGIRGQYEYPDRYGCR